MQEIIDELRELHKEMADLSKQLTVPPEVLARCEGTDKSGAIRVVLNGAGLVVKVTVAAGWRKSIRTHEVGAAALEAIQEANQARLVRWADAVTSQENAPAAPAPLRKQEPALAGDPAVVVDQLLGLMDGVENEMAGKGESIMSLAVRRTEGQGPGGHATVTLRGKDIVQIDVDAEWLTLASHQDVGAEISGAIRRAYQVARDHAADVVPASASSKLAALCADPQKLVAALGLG